MQPAMSPDLFRSAVVEAKRAHVAGDFGRARSLYLNLLRQEPDDPGILVLLAELDMREGRLATARKGLEHLAARHPDSVETRAALANVLEELGDVSATTAFYREETTARPNDIDAWAKLAGALQLAGRIGEAVQIYRRILDRWPESAAGYYGLAANDPGLVGPDEVVALKAIAADPARRIAERVRAYFALGHVLEARREYDAAFAAFADGNRLRRENPEMHAHLPLPFDVPPAEPAFTSVEQAERTHEAFVRETIRMFTPEYLAKFAGGGDASCAPIFIVGMPRSGSTLLEQILSSHPQVQGLGETSALSRTFREALARLQRSPAAFDPLSFYRDVGRAYLAALRELGWAGVRRPIDKMLGNYLNVGLIHLALPNAVVLHSVRDPVDTCLSNFRQLFGKKNETSYDLGAVGRQYVRYRDMMRHWDRVLPGRVVDIEHERLVADAEQGIRDLVARCGLPWNDACLRFNESERIVRTASVSQVRRPISDAAVERWRKYDRHLAPLFEALGPFAPAPPK